MQRQPTENLAAEDVDHWADFWRVHSDVYAGFGLLQMRIGYSFKNVDLLYEALTHRSAVSDFEMIRRHGSGAGSHCKGLIWNERLEFLGDSVLGLVITTYLWQRHSALAEGELSRVRASLINETTLAQVARSISLGESIALGRGEEMGGGRARNGLLADAMEALIGALYLDDGFERAQDVVHRLFLGLLQQEPQGLESDAKTGLQELTQQHYKTTPSYRILTENGPDHAKEFEIEVLIGERVLAIGKGVNKKKASQAAARAALEIILVELETEKRGLK